METAIVRFEPAGWSIEIKPATAENEAFAAKLKELAAPFHLAMEYEKLSEERANRIVAKAVAETVIVSGFHPELPVTPEGWETWLLEHIEEMIVLLQTAAVPDAWRAMARGDYDTHQP